MIQYIKHMHGIEQQATQFIFHGLLALFGGLVHALSAHRAGKTKSVSDFFFLTLVSSFTGVVVFLIGLTYIPDQPYLIGALAGTGGFMGIEGMTLIIPFIKSRILNIFNIKEDVDS